MRLVACSECRAQFDVTALAEDQFRCHCGAEVDARPHPAVDAPVARCGGCGALVADRADTCTYCGASIVRDPDRLSLICPECCARMPEDARFCTACGVAIDPAKPEDGEGRELPCPACEALMPPHHVGDVRVSECRACHGLWAPGASFDRLVARAFEARRAAGRGAQLERGPRVDRGNPVAQELRYRRCPECGEFMLRRNYRRSSGVVLDVCTEHGSWLDPDELEQIAGFLLSGGAPGASPGPSHAQRRAAAAFARGVAARGPRRRQPLEGMALGSFLDILTRLLS